MTPIVFRIFLGLLSAAAVVSIAASHPADSSIAIQPAELPMSEFASDQAGAAFLVNRQKMEEHKPPPLTDMEPVRRFWKAVNDQQLDTMNRAYRTLQKSTTVGGVAVHIVEPAEGVSSDNSERVLINLHGGAFLWGAGSGALVEAIPIAATGRYRVVTVDYRLAPENRYPAASQDVERVYRDLLQHYRAENIGIYGCSAGGALTAEATAWIIDKGLPRPGAIGTFCGTGLPFGGDSATMGQLAMGQPPMTSEDPGGDALAYLAGVKRTDSLAFPGNSPGMLMKFPPTLLIAGGRDFAVSALTTMARRLRGAGVDSELVLFDGLGHAFFMDPNLPESREVFTVVSRFFDRHLGRLKR